MLARVFQSLAERKPDLDAGVFAYAKAGFGDYPGFLSAFGYWIGSCIGNVSYWVLIKSTLGRLLPGLRRRQHGRGDRRRFDRHLAVPFHDPARHPAGRLHQQHRHGRQDRADPGLHRDPVLRLQARPVPRQFLRRRRHAGQALFEQVRATMLVTVFVFLGIEGASVYSRFAQEALRRRRGDDPRLRRRHRADGAGHAAALRGAAARRDRRHAPAVDGDGAGGRGRALGRGLRQRRPARLGARRLPGLVADLRRGAVRRGQDRGHADGVRHARTRTRCRPRRCG